ncbi:hypothetical protein MYK68_09570 [Gordonia sp. PP30]|uniref:hypothetical protein n=1 Tax=unclassified Gordonia (in: high G+C Gram-positive bacteria) TaxID=2657482 RepID=UPI001FFE86AB|nr:MULTISPECIES: hypothetical protein [unclassified Gordonia (in: high G+C Gram-positive bacteria)]UQE76776.1 hypothetical protein MYK68_09570 [Gordonia sp. PP30]
MNTRATQLDLTLPDGYKREDSKRSKEEDDMRNRTSPDLSSRVRGITRRLNQRMHMSAADRLNMQVAHTPVAVLGSAGRRS